MRIRVQNCILFSEKQLKNTFQVRLVKFAEREKPSRAKRIFVPSRLSFSVQSPPLCYIYMSCMFTLQNGQNYYVLKMEMFHQNMCSVSTSFQTENNGHKSAKLSCFQLNFIPPGKTYKYNTWWTLSLQLISLEAVMMLRTCDYSTDMQFVCCLIRVTWLLEPFVDCL